MSEIAIVGSGVVGGATGKGFISKGYSVTFVDVNPTLICKLRDEGYHAVSIKEMDLTNTEYIFVSVSTPTDATGRIVLDHLVSAVTTIGQKLQGAMEKNHLYRLVVVRSTMPPGTLSSRVVPFLEQVSGGKAGKDFGVAVNPEYLREAQAEKDFADPWIIVVGVDDEAAKERLIKLYRPFECPLYTIPTVSAEFQKYVHNLYNATKISFFNEMRTVAKILGIDADEVFRLVVKSAEGMWNPEYGMRDLGAFAGSCLPKDTNAFLTFAEEELGVKLALLSATIQINEFLKDKSEQLD